MLEKPKEQLETELKFNLSDMAIQTDIKGTIMYLCWVYFEIQYSITEVLNS